MRSKSSALISRSARSISGSAGTGTAAVPLAPGQLHAVEEAAEGVQRVAPGVPLVGDELLQDAERHRLVAAVADLQRAGDPRAVAEVGLLGQEAADLEVGVDPRLQLAEELQDQPVAEADRGVALLGLERRGLRSPSPRISAKAGEAVAASSLRSPAEAPARRSTSASSWREISGRRTGRRAGRSPRSRPIRAATTCGQPRRAQALRPLGVRVGSEGERQGVELGLGLRVVHPQQRQDRAGR